MQGITNQRATARDTYARLLQIYTRRFGPDDTNHTANTASQLAYTHMVLGDYAAAAALMEEVIATRTRVFGAQSDTVVSDLLFLGDILWKQDEPAAAKEAQTLAAFEHALGPDNPTALAFVAGLASRYSSREDTATAQHYIERAIESAERSDQPDKMPISAMRSLFGLLWRRHEDAAARALFERFLPVSPIVAPNKYGAPALLPLLNALRWGHGDAAATAIFYERLLTFSEQAHGADHADTGAVLLGWTELLLFDGVSGSRWVLPIAVPRVTPVPR